MMQLRLRYRHTFIDEERPAEAMARSKSEPTLGRAAMGEEVCGFMNLRLLVYPNSLCFETRVYAVSFTW